jgi:hypothetical protein
MSMSRLIIQFFVPTSYKSPNSNGETDTNVNSTPLSGNGSLACQCEYLLLDVIRAGPLRGSSRNPLKDSIGCLFSLPYRTMWPRRTASAIASVEIDPRHRSVMASHAIPRATSSRTSLTKTRVPRNVGRPWQTSGSETTKRPKNLLSAAPR